MRKKMSRSEWLSFAYLIGFMILSVTLGSMFFSKIVVLVSDYAWIRYVFMFFLFAIVIASALYIAYKCSVKAYNFLQKLSPLFAKLEPYTNKWMEKIRSFAKKAKEQYKNQTHNIGFISNFSISKKKKEK